MPEHPTRRRSADAVEAAERARRQTFLALPMSERLRQGVAFCRFALRNLGAARRDRR